MLKLSVKIDSRAATTMLDQFTKQTRYAQKQALNAVAFKILTAERAGIASTFKHPRPFTVKNNFYTKATLEKPVATIGIKPRAAIYLSPYEFGGLHFLPTRPELGAVLLIPVGIKVDQYGQIPSGAVLARILARPDVFVGTVGGVLGVWQRPPRGVRRDGTRGTKGALTTNAQGQRTGLKLLLQIGHNRPVHEHLDFEKRGKTMFEKEFHATFEVEFAKAWANRKK